MIAVQVDPHHEHLTFAVIETVKAFDNASPEDWIARRLEPEWEVYSDGLACFRRLEDAGHAHTALDTGGGGVDIMREPRPTFVSDSSMRCLRSAAGTPR